MKTKRPCLLAMALFLPAALALPAEPDAVEKAAREWLQLRTESARLESEWREQRRLLEAGLSALKARSEQLKTSLETEKSTSQKDQSTLNQIEVRNQLLRESLRSSSEATQKTSEALLALRPSLPPRLSQALELPYRSLASKELRPEERCQLVVTVLNRCLDFNRTITTSEEIIPVEGSPESKVQEVVYWGLSHAYALDRKASRASLGTPGPQGWEWKPLPGAEQAVATLLSIAHGKADPDFVEAPLLIPNGRGRNP